MIYFLFLYCKIGAGEVIHFKLKETTTLSWFNTRKKPSRFGKCRWNYQGTGQSLHLFQPQKLPKISWPPWKHSGLHCASLSTSFILPSIVLGGVLQVFSCSWCSFRLPGCFSSQLFSCPATEWGHKNLLSCLHSLSNLQEENWGKP